MREREMIESMKRHRMWATWTALALFVSVVTVTATPPAALAASPASSDSLADFEGLAPPPEFFVFFGGSTVTTTPVTVGDADVLARPAQVGDNDILEVDYNVTDFGGFGQAFDVVGPQDWSGYTSFDFWFHGTGSGLNYQAEISDNRSNPAADTSERFDYVFTDTTAGWQYITIPFEDFTRATDFQPGGAPDDGFTLTEIWAWAIVLPQGADAVHFDDFGIGLKVVDDFESGLPSGTDGDGVNIGFHTFQDGGSSVGISTATTPPAPAIRAGGGEPNNVMQVDLDVNAFAGFIHSFENDTVDTWVPQDWSAYSGFALWMYGTGTGIDAFIDVLGARNAGSTVDDAQRWRLNFKDDIAGWRYLEIPFADLAYFGVGNGAPGPGEGLDLTDIGGWAFGTLGTGGPVTYYFDDFALFGVAEVPPLTVAFETNRTDIAEGTTGVVTVKLNRALNDEDPAQVSVDFATESATSIATAGREYTPTAGTLTFVNGGPASLTFEIETFDDSKWEWDERIALRLSNPVDVALGLNTQASAFIVGDDDLDPYLIDDFEEGAYLWAADDSIDVAAREIATSDPLGRPGQDAYENALEAVTPLVADVTVDGSVCNSGNGVIPVALLTTDTFDATTVDHATVQFGGATEAHVSNKTGIPQRHEEDYDGDGDLDLLFHFRGDETGYDCDTASLTLTGATFGGQLIVADGPAAQIMHDFALGEDWTRGEALSFWYYGTGSGDEITTVLKDNRAPDPGPAGWNMVWSDEFDAPAGTPPDPETWNFEIGDVTPDGKDGWGNQELQYYTDDPANASTDGAGNLAITLQEADGSLECFYGTCEYTSARLTSWHKAEFAYGRLESRVLVPRGTGIWPAFWSLGTDFDEVLWPQTGEIDIMEFVGRVPNETFGTIHGPGYSGGASFSQIVDFGEPVYNDYHTFAIEWEPDVIRWYVDGEQYHEATPADVAPNEWVFNDSLFFLLNVAVGGNFGGTVGDDLVPPQSLLVDYVRVYQGPDTAERWEASFVDNFEGWQEVVIPFDSLTRSADQPAGAPDDGLTLSDVWGYGFELPEGGTTGGSMLMDQVRVQLTPPPTEITVTNLGNGGPGSLREALDEIAIGGTISFDPGLAGGTIALGGPLVPPSSAVIDGSGAPELTLDGSGFDRVLIVDAGLDVTVTDVTMTNGFGFQLAGCVLNNGSLTLDHVTVTGCLMTTDAGDFWQGGGGIYSGDGATLNLIDSTVSDNTSGWTGGGVYSFFNTTTNVTRSTITGNVALDVAGGFRTLGDVNVDNSTISGNTSTAWHGGGMFITDGVANVTNSTVTGNNAPGGTTGGLFVGTFGPSSATLNLQNTIVADNGDFGCFLAPFGAGVVALNSLGNNVFTDATCAPIGSDQVVADAGLDVLADNGGPTLTHALLPGSPALDGANAAVCPATDQRGVIRPQGVGCDIGAYEAE